MQLCFPWPPFRLRFGGFGPDTSTLVLTLSHLRAQTKTVLHLGTGAFQILLLETAATDCCSQLCCNGEEHEIWPCCHCFTVVVPAWIVIAWFACLVGTLRSRHPTKAVRAPLILDSRWASLFSFYATFEELEALADPGVAVR